MSSWAGADEGGGVGVGECFLDGGSGKVKGEKVGVFKREIRGQSRRW